jgi:predicted DNA-binding transcriptional regulator YafY
VLRLDYRDEGGSASVREIEPLCLAFWGGKWTLGAWCRLRADFRNFRPDRIAAIDETGERFAPVPGRDLDAYMRAMRVSYDGLE